MEKRCETCGIKYKYCDCFMEYTNFKDDLTEYKCCNKNNRQKFDEKLKKCVFNTCTFSNHDKNKFILLLQKDVYPYQYMDDWEKFAHGNAHKKLFQDFEIKDLGKYHDLYVQNGILLYGSDTLLLVDVFENF